MQSKIITVWELTQDFQSVSWLILIPSLVSNDITRKGTKFYNRPKNPTEDIVHYSANPLKKLNSYQVFSNVFIHALILSL